MHNGNPLYGQFQKQGNASSKNLNINNQFTLRQSYMASSSIYLGNSHNRIGKWVGDKNSAFGRIRGITTAENSATRNR